MPDVAALREVLDDDLIQAVERTLREFSSYHPSSRRAQGASSAKPGEGAGWRHDVTRNLLRSGGTSALEKTRGNYFRANYAYRGRVHAPRIGPLLVHEALIEPARRLYGRDHVVPLWVYANVLLPGQELAVHTDVPEFIGAGRDVLPEGGAGIIVCAVHPRIHPAADRLLGNRPIQMPPPALTHSNGGKTGRVPLEISSRSWGRMCRTHGS